jgi:hypothetical protein
MAERKSPKSQKSLEMRVAELEDKLSKTYITEEELKAHHKVVSLLGYTPLCCWPPIHWPCGFAPYGKTEGGGPGPTGSGFQTLGTKGKGKSKGKGKIKGK